MSGSAAAAWAAFALTAAGVLVGGGLIYGRLTSAIERLTDVAEDHEGRLRHIERRPAQHRRAGRHRDED